MPRNMVLKRIRRTRNALKGRSTVNDENLASQKGQTNFPHGSSGVTISSRCCGPIFRLSRSRGRWAPVFALISDFVDGKLARATGTETSFGQYADFFADAAFWIWFSGRYETSRTICTATFAVWALPVVPVASVSFARGQMIDVPRAWWFRPAAAVQVLLGARMVARWFRPTHYRGQETGDGSLLIQGPRCIDLGGTSG